MIKQDEFEIKILFCKNSITLIYINVILGFLNGFNFFFNEDILLNTYVACLS